MSQLDRRQALRLLAAAGAAGSLAPLLSACSGSGGSGGDTAGATGEAIRVGMIVPKSGANKGIGDEIANGFQLYLKSNNGRLGDHPVTLEIADEGDSPATAKAAAEQLLKQQIRLLTGVSSAEVLGAVRDVVEKQQVPLVTPAPSPADLGNATYLWRTGYVTDEPGKALGRWVADHTPGSTVVIGGDSAANRADATAFVAALRAAGGTVVGEPAFVAPRSKELNTRLTAARSPSVGSLVCMYGGVAAVELVKQLKDSGLPRTLQIYGPGTLTEGALLSQQGDAASGIFTAMNYAMDINNADNRRFVADYQKTYSTGPTAYAMASHDAAAVLAGALNIAGADTSSLTINGAIGKLGQVQSPRGQWQFNQNRTPLQKWFLRQVKADGPVLANVLTAELVTLG